MLLSENREGFLSSENREGFLSSENREGLLLSRSPDLELNLERIDGFLEDLDGELERLNFGIIISEIGNRWV
ncbi:hypothetical protein A19Y_3541 [Planktothrix agardhii NIVA-CYA 126/8]|uniref:Uncharacterized protein n=1 Tax=Planktothrix agardhii (strain NIVA-CYA 126/8) TaxID=388467 RepID=A0A073CKU6_PLAA1|nr:hypothetical protein A19Y_3541 [Planktothrix agardhii NIVA-CYA 126/8]